MSRPMDEESVPRTKRRPQRPPGPPARRATDEQLRAVMARSSPVYAAWHLRSSCSELVELETVLMNLAALCERLGRDDDAAQILKMAISAADARDRQRAPA